MSVTKALVIDAPWIDQILADIVGGANRSLRAPKCAEIDWGGADIAESDIDGAKCIFRTRGWVKTFFADNDAAPGDRVRVEETAPYAYRVSLIKRDGML